MMAIFAAIVKHGGYYSPDHRYARSPSLPQAVKRENKDKFFK
jgi:hypothetical protein